MQFSGVNWRQLAKLALVVALVQGVYWIAINKPVFRASLDTPPPMVEPISTEIARINEPTLAAAAKANYKAVELPWTHCCDTAMFAVRIQFDIDTIPPHGLGIISDLEVDNYILAVNGSPLVARGRMQPGNGSFHGQIRYLTRIPSGILKPGRNEVTYVTLRDGFPYTDILAPRIASYDALERHSARPMFFVSGYPLIAGTILGLLGLLATIMVFRSEDWRFAAWLSALCAALVANFAYGLWLDPPIDGWGRMLAFFAISQFIPAAMLCFIDSWTKAPIRWLQPLTMLVYALSVGAIAWYIYRVPMPDGFDVPTTIWIWHLMGSAIAVMLRLLWHFATRSEDRLLESGLLSVMAVALMIDASSAWFPEQHLPAGNIRNSSVFLLLAMMVAFIARNFRLFQSQATINNMLQAKVEQREAELEDAHAREQLLVSKQAHDDERRRIMRDLHDGLGSQLMSMMLSARLGEADPPKVAEGLQGVIDEMRLMVDSMDSVGESLDAALATFRARVQPRVQQAGFAFEWQQAGAIELPGYGPRDVLQIFRILQEAVTNALKHSGGSLIRVVVRQHPDSSVEIAVSDDGKGGAVSGDAGRGLANMQNRAASIGAQLALESGGGTHVRLTLPQHQIAAEE